MHGHHSHLAKETNPHGAQLAYIMLMCEVKQKKKKRGDVRVSTARACIEVSSGVKRRLTTVHSRWVDIRLTFPSTIALPRPAKGFLHGHKTPAKTNKQKKQSLHQQHKTTTQNCTICTQSVNKEGIFVSDSSFELKRDILTNFCIVFFPPRLVDALAAFICKLINSTSETL